MKVFYTDQFVLPLPDGHRFPMEKYRLLREAVAALGAESYLLEVPPPATDAQLHRAHSEDYVARVTGGRLSSAEIRALGFPWSPELVERSRRSVGATIAACRAALVEGAAASLAGGTHHAGRAEARGFCVFNDIAVALLTLQQEGLIREALVVDCDVHQGDGTAEILNDSPHLTAFSIHARRNYPARKVPGDIDIALEDGCDDATYLAELTAALERCLELSSPDLVVYLAGADPYAGDRLGRLSISQDGLARRDALVVEHARAAGAALATVMGGGYARTVDDSVAVHLASITATRTAWRGRGY